MFSQEWQKVKESTNSDKKHSKFPYYIEIDTTIIKNSNNVTVYFNDVRIKPKGNKFYLPGSPYKSKYSISLNNEAKKDLSKVPEKPFTTTKEFNLKHKDDFYKIKSYGDTIVAGNLYKAEIIIDTSKVKGLKNIKVIFGQKAELQRNGNVFKLGYYPFKIGLNEYEITILNGNNTPIKFTHNVYEVIPKKNKTKL